MDSRSPETLTGRPAWYTTPVVLLTRMSDSTGSAGSEKVSVTAVGESPSLAPAGGSLRRRPECAAGLAVPSVRSRSAIAADQLPADRVPEDRAAVRTSAALPAAAQQGDAQGQHRHRQGGE